MNSRPTALLAAFLLIATHLCGSDTMWVTGPRSETVPLHITAENKIFIRAFVNDHEVTLYIDTGSGTVIDSKLAERLKIDIQLGGPGFALDGTSMHQGSGRLAALRFGKMVISGLPVQFVDLTAMRKLHAEHGFPDIDGVIGVDVLATLGAEIDFDAKLLHIRRPSKA